MVLFPAPLGPRNPKMEFLGTCRFKAVKSFCVSIGLAQPLGVNDISVGCVHIDIFPFHFHCQPNQLQPVQTDQREPAVAGDV